MFVKLSPSIQLFEIVQQKREPRIVLRRLELFRRLFVALTRRLSKMIFDRFLTFDDLP